MTKKRGQEEMVGFALIVVLVAIIGLVFLGVSLREPQEKIVDSEEVENFVQAFLQHTTDCGNYVETYLPIQKLISSCVNGETCLDERDSCDVLDSILTEIVDKSWKIDGDRPIKGYKLEIILEDGTEIIPSIEKGNSTKNSRGVSQPFTPLGENYEIYFTVYY